MGGSSVEAQTDSETRLYTLDVLRGIAALSVVFWHWRHFFFVGATPGVIEQSRLPLNGMLFILFTKGWMAVDLFFGLSGFIFYWLYSKKIQRKSVSPFEFAVLRFSRLYPLHLLTLCLAALGQFWFLRTQGAFFAWPSNDLWHFVLNLGFASSWGLEMGYSFNVPIWSVSVEILLYALFFVLCRFLPVRFLVLVIVAFIGFFVVLRVYGPVGRGVVSFFLGGLMFLIYEQIQKSPQSFRISNVVIMVNVLFWIITGLIIFFPNIVAIIGMGVLPINNAKIQFLIQKSLNHFPVLVLFPSTILSLALLERSLGRFAKSFSILGEISYSSYLLHFPLQMVFAGVLLSFGVSKDIFYAPMMMLVFFAVLISLSFFSYRFFEIPLQKFLRSKLLKSKVARV
jgi:peptidoglycan/LPS O-acetylase OafA/YrhL